MKQAPMPTTDDYEAALRSEYGGTPTSDALIEMWMKDRRDLESELAKARATRPEELVPQKPIAWLHRRHTTAYVITDTIKQLWLKAKPEHVENYTVPLYFGESLAAPVSPQLIPTEKP